MVLLAALDIQKDDQILCNYEPTRSAAKDDNVSLGQLFAFATRAWILASRVRVIVFF